MYATSPGQGPMTDSSEHGNKISSSLKCEEFQFLKNFAPGMQLVTQSLQASAEI